MQLFTDTPISSIAEDKFCFAPYAEVLSDTIMKANSLPFCVGIFGPWGSGKTSFMKMLQALIDKQNKREAGHIQIQSNWFKNLYKQIEQEAEHSKVQTIWFNPWKYDKKEDLWNALIQTILDFIAERSKDKEVLRKAGILALAATWLTLKKAVTAVTAGVIDASNIDEVVKSFSVKDEKYYRHINQFEKDFADVVNRYVKGDKGGRLVIFIDDLDRCLPENAITVLESLKLFFGNAHCIFVLGIDHKVVEEGIKQRYGENAEINIDGRAYLDKIIQVPLFLPRVTSEMLKNSLLTDDGGPILIKEIWNIIEKGMRDNPRKTMRFINSFYLLQQFLKHRDQKNVQKDGFFSLSQERQDIYLAKLLVFEMSFPEFYQHLLDYPGDWEYLENQILPARDTEREQRFKFTGKLELGRLWESSIPFQNFMRETRTGAPEDKIVRSLLGAINLVTVA